MTRMRGFDRRAVVRLLAVAIPALALATAGVALLQFGLGIPNPSALYIVAVVATAYVSGTAGAVVSAIASFLLYDYFFVDPRYTFTISDPDEYLSVILLLFVGIVVGQLAALQRSRTRDAVAREREAHALFRVSRSLATRDSTPQVLPDLARVLVDDNRLAERGRGANSGADAKGADMTDARKPARAGETADQEAGEIGRADHADRKGGKALEMGPDRNQRAEQTVADEKNQRRKQDGGNGGQFVHHDGDPSLPAAAVSWRRSRRRYTSTTTRIPATTAIRKMTRAASMYLSRISLALSPKKWTSRPSITTNRTLRARAAKNRK